MCFKHPKSYPNVFNKPVPYEPVKALKKRNFHTKLHNTLPPLRGLSEKYDLLFSTIEKMR
jgi:hypothetical protein